MMIMIITIKIIFFFMWEIIWKKFMWEKIYAGKKIKKIEIFTEYLSDIQ